MLLLVTWLVLAVLRLGDAQLSCQDAARAAARAAARGEPRPSVVETARAAAPDGAEVDVDEAVPASWSSRCAARVRWAGPWAPPTFTVPAGRSRPPR